MHNTPNPVKVYHITHLSNLPQILRDGGLFSDAEIRRRGAPHNVVGMAEIKERRLRDCRVDCHPGTMVGEYVPFHFCPRSVMLYLLHMGNHPGIVYRGGQRPLIHLQADLRTVVAWATRHNVRWAFTDVNAGAKYAKFFADFCRLTAVNWDAVAAADWRDPAVKEGKQAEFLVQTSLPRGFVEKIGVIDWRIQHEIQEATRGAAHRPVVAVQRDWYY